MDENHSSGLIAGRFRIAEAIGSGSHCRVYKGNAYKALDQATGKHVAVKFAVASKRNLVLKREAKIGNLLAEEKPGFARTIWYGRLGEEEIGVSELLGPSLLDYILGSHRKFSYKSVLMLGEQLLVELEALHCIGYLHCDLKPDNFLMGLGAASGLVHIIDFSLSRKYVRKGTHKKAKRTEFFGNPYWASIKVLSGLAASRQDDIEALLNVFLFLLTGHLPWQQIKHHNYAEKRARLLTFRKSLPLEKAFQGLPAVFPHIVAYARSLQHEDSPDYTWIKAELRKLANSLHVVYDYRYEWDVPGLANEINYNCLGIMQEERCLMSEDHCVHSYERISPEPQGRKRANSADEPPISISKLLTTLQTDSDSSSPTKSQSPSRRMRSLAVHTRGASPGALLSSRSPIDPAQRRASMADFSNKKPDAQSKRRASIAETEEEETDDEVSLPALHPEVRGKISRLRVALK